MNPFRRIGAVLAPWLVSLALAGVAVAQEPPSAAPEGESAAESRAAAFRSMEGPAEESVPGGALMVAAYAVIWLLLFGYLVRLAQLQSRNAAELSRIEGMVRRADTARSEGA